MVNPTCVASARKGASLFLRSTCILLIVLSCSGWLFVTDARAQASTGGTTAAPDDERAQARNKTPMDGFAFGLNVGIAHVGTGDVRNPTYIQGAESIPPAQLAAAGLLGEGCTPIDKRCTTEARRGVHVAIPLQLGGSIVGFRLEPYMTLSSAAKAYGVYTGPTFEFHIAQPLYLGLGFGLKAAWVKDQDWKYAADIYGRIPMRATYYVADDFALVLEFGFGAGASGYVSELKDIINPVTGKRIARRQDITFGFGRTWDLSLGVRFP